MEPPNTPYIEAAEKAVDCSFRSFEVAEVTWVKEGSKVTSPHFSGCLNMQVNMTVGRGCRAGKGLGKYGQGIRQPIVLPKAEPTFGLGYKPNRIEKSEAREEKKRKRVAALRGGNLYPRN